MAHETWINLCECGEERKIRTAPKGIWRRGGETHYERVKTYPEVWKRILSDLIGAQKSDVVISLDKFGRLGLPWSEAEDLAKKLVIDGIAERFEKYPRRSTKDTKIVISEEIIRKLRVLLGLNKRESEEDAVTAFFDNWMKLKSGDSFQQVADVPAGSLIDQMAELWHAGNRSVLPLTEGPVVVRSLVSYKLILETLKAIALLNLAEETMPFRELSVKVSGDSKCLAAVKPYLKSFLGNLEDHGITEHASLIFCHMPVVGEINYRSVDLSASEDYSVVTKSTALKFKPIHGKFDSILLVENQTAFEKVVNKLPENIGCIFISGYPASYIRTFVKRLLDFNPASGLIWCDMDPDGIEIALTAGKWFEEAGLEWKPLGMDVTTFLNAKTYKPLEEADRRKIKTLKARMGTSFFHALLDEMEETEKKVEQEAVRIDEALLPWRSAETASLATSASGI